MLKVMSLYEANPEAWARIAAENPSCAEMARHFDKGRDMEAALNYSNGVVGHWVAGRSRVSAGSERRAREWLNARIAPKATQALFDLAPPAPASAMLLVVAPDPAKATKVLQLLGCEVTEI